MGIFKTNSAVGGAQVEPNFETYRETFAKKPVVVTVDMNFADMLPVPDLPACLKIQLEVYVDETNPDLISGAELSHLSDLRGILSQHFGGRFVGQGIIASQESAFLMFYCTDKQAKQAKAMLQETFVGSFRHSELSIIYDPEGEEYKKFLYPKPVKQRQISNAKMLRTLKGYGDDGLTPRDIKYHLQFTSRPAAMELYAKCADKGFTYVDLEKVPAPEGLVLPRYNLTMTKNMPFALDLLEVVDAYLLELAGETQAVYQNIETDVIDI